ncbi:MAG TPA: MmgE/PrpD family protein [Xanthobacteraceae bacterium]|nr:MmgE/PrpD family protein [Xanthobacteraceae bacterium]
MDASAGADATVRAVVRYAADVRFAALPADAVHACKRRLADTLACGIAAYDAEPSRIARALALRTEAGEGARVLGTARRALPELAAFANAAMARYLDGNDCFPGGGGHPSGVIAPVLAAAQVAGADGRDVIAAIVVGYEVHRAMHESLRLMTRGLDHAFYPAVAAAAATAKILRLDAAQMANAISLAVTPNLPLAVTRRGQLSMWKGVAEANGVRNGVFAALLAQAGMTGPERPFDGALGLRDLAGPVDVACLGRAPLAIMAADMKFFVTEYHSQGPLAAALSLGGGLDVEEVAAIHIRTYEFAHREIGSGAEKWRPATRETADHSLPYIVAASLIDGGFNDAIFAPARFSDPRILALADKITVAEDPAFTRAFPDKFPCHVEISLRDGTTRAAGLEVPHGHHDDPLTDAEVATKFTALAGRQIAPPRLAQAWELIEHFERCARIDDLFDALAVGHAD